MGIQLNVIGPNNQEKIVDLCDNDDQMKKFTVQDLREKIVEEFSLSTGDKIRMVFGIETLEESSKLSFYGIRHMSTVHTLLILPGGL